MHYQKHTEETKRKIAIAKLGNKCALGHKLSEESKQKISKSMKGKTYAPEIYVGRANKQRGKHVHTPESKRKLSLFHTGRKHSDVTIEKLRLAKLGKKLSEETKRKMSGSAKRSWTEERKEAKRIWAIEMWQTNKDNYVNKIMGRREKTGIEMAVEKIILDNNLPFCFVGNGQFRLGRMNPDFVHLKKQKIIEVFGEYFHKKSDESKRIKNLLDFGYECLVIWGNEIQNDNEVAKKIIEYERR